MPQEVTYLEPINLIYFPIKYLLLSLSQLNAENSVNASCALKW